MKLGHVLDQGKVGVPEGKKSSLVENNMACTCLLQLLQPELQVLRIWQVHEQEHSGVS